MGGVGGVAVETISKRFLIFFVFIAVNQLFFVVFILLMC